jgi:excisionase family DNA binding protein
MTRLEAAAGVRSDDSLIGPSGKMTLTDVEVATRLGVSRFTLRSWRIKGHGPKFLKMGRAVRYRPDDVDEYERQALVETQVPPDHHPA